MILETEDKMEQSSSMNSLDEIEQLIQETNSILNKIGPIIVADDSKLNLELIRLNLNELGVIDDVTYCSDG